MNIKSIIRNKPFILLLCFNIGLSFFFFDYGKHYVLAKSKVVYFLGEMGIERYKNRVQQRAYNMDNVLLYFNKNMTSKIEAVDDNNIKQKINYNSELFIRPGYYKYEGGGMILARKVIIT